MPRPGLKIRSKFLLMIGALVILTMAANAVVLELLLMPSFERLDREAAINNVARVKEAINNELKSLSTQVTADSNWDDTYNFVESGDREVIDQNINLEYAEKIGINVFGIYDLNSQKLYEAVFDFSIGSTLFEDSRLPSRLGIAGRLAADAGGEGGGEGIVLAGERIILFASQPVLKSSGEGPSRGTLVMGRFLDEGVTDALRRRTRVQFDLIPIGTAIAGNGRSAALDSLIDSGDDTLVERTGTNKLAVYSLLRDLNGDTALLLKAELPNDISAMGRKVLLVALGGLLLASLTVAAAIGFLLQRSLIAPVTTLTRHVLAIGRSGDVSRRVAINRNDEIGALAHEFDRMLQSLADARNRLLDQSYQSGVAEMASGVLHNVRNHMTPLTLRLGRMLEQPPAERDRKVDLAIGELTQPAPLPSRQERLATYLRMSIDNLVETHNGLRDQLNDISEDFKRIDFVLRDLETFSRANAGLESVSLAGVVRETIGLVPQFADLQITVRLDPALDDQPPVLATAFILKHVLHNLLVNAVEAIAASGRRRGTIAVRVAAAPDGNADRLDLGIADDGIGIEAAMLEAIFNRGFSTKTGSKRGIGLHWCANAIAAMGGRIFATSAGVGQGATFHVVLQVATAAGREAA